MILSASIQDAGFTRTLVHGARNVEQVSPIEGDVVMCLARFCSASASRTHCVRVSASQRKEISPGNKWGPPEIKMHASMLQRKKKRQIRERIPARACTVTRETTRPD